jgi:glycosyltransferase involved in cell wall biosynthesis
LLIHAATDIDIHPPVFGGAQRCLGLYRGLARHHTVRALCMVPNRSRGVDEERVDGVEIVRRRAWYTALAWRLEQARLSPLFLAERGHRAQALRLLGELGRTPDVLMTDLHLGALRDHSSARLKVHHAQNVEADHFRSAGPRLLARGMWAERLRAMESRAVAGADLTVAASDEDAARLAARYGTPAERLVVAPNGYDETAIRPPAPAARARARANLGIGERDVVCAFVGSDVPHNRAGLSWLIEHVMPGLRAEGFRLLVVGAVARMLSRGREPWLIVAGESRDLSSVLDAADIGLNPALAGGGSNTKLPTYLAAGLSVVTTPHGLRGFPTLAPLVSVAEPAAMAEALRTRPQGWAREPGATLPEPVAAFAWGAIGEHLGEVFAARLAPASGGTGSAAGESPATPERGARRLA